MPTSLDQPFAAPMRDAMIAGFFSAWFVLLLIRQCGLWPRLVGRRDILKLFPNWALFTGLGGDRDLRLFARFGRTDGSFTNWEPLHEPHRSPVAGVWNPDFLSAQVQSHCLRKVVGLRETPFTLQQSGSWSVLRDLVVEQARQRHFASAQFRVTVSRVYDPAFVPRTLLTSPLFAAAPHVT